MNFKILRSASKRPLILLTVGGVLATFFLFLGFQNFTTSSTSAGTGTSQLAMIPYEDYLIPVPIGGRSDAITAGNCSLVSDTSSNRDAQGRSMRKQVFSCIDANHYTYYKQLSTLSVNGNPALTMKNNSQRFRVGSKVLTVQMGTK